MKIKEEIEGIEVTVDYSKDCKKHKIYRCPICFPDDDFNKHFRERWT